MLKRPTEVPRLILGLACVVFFGMQGCGADSSRDPGAGKVANRDIKTVMDDHVDGLMNMPGVVGVYIGETDDGEPCIKVMVLEGSDDAKKQIPETLDGHSVLIVETDEFKPMGGGSP